MKILFLEPFFTGSHRSFAEGIQRNSSHEIELLTLPGRFWKWRMRGAALEFSRRYRKDRDYDLVVASDLMDLAQWKALNPDMTAPHILYVHENQLAYPVKEGEQRDFQYGWTDFTNMLCADKIVFNSFFNRASFFSELDSLISRLPDYRPPRDFTKLLEKSLIIPPGCTLASSWKKSAKYEETGRPPLIIWNHRWEHDKNPEDFFQALKELKKRGIPFRLALLGESYKDSPDCFSHAKTLFKEELVHFGFLRKREDYEHWLEQADFVISTAKQENFGISVVEALSFGAIPLLPDRLAYPEVLPKGFHNDLLYRTPEELPEKLISMMRRPDLRSAREKLSTAVQPYSWTAVIKRFENLFEETLKTHGTR